MSGSYPDGVTAASFDEYWNTKLDSPETCADCDTVLLPDGKCPECDFDEEEES